ncbi:MAG TPA: redoxin domain-containing protein [Gemmatimonadaceae bacterium]|nr:redoxin domain-containing protein [Gemmatimonadaceae bacterium]
MTDMTPPKRRSRKLRIFGVVLVALLLVGAVAARRIAASADPETLPEQLAVGGPAPAFTAVDTRGKSHSLADYGGKWVVLEWFNHGCPYTKKHYELVNGVGNSQAMQQEYTKRGVIWLSVVSSGPGRQGYTSAEKADEQARKKGAAPTAIIRDTAGVLGRLYGARNTPQYAIIDAKGVLRYSGAIDNRQTSSAKDIVGATNYVRAALDSGLAGRPIAVAQTQPYGCEVKY